MSEITTIIAGAGGADGALNFTVPDEWKQGRTVFGGLSAALAIVAGRRLVPDARPLRPAQFAFAGPVEGEVASAARVLRSGRRATNVAVELSSAPGFGLNAMLLYAEEAESSLERVHDAMPQVPPPDDCIDGRHPKMPAFTAAFDFRIARIDQAAGEVLMWIRLRDRDCLPVEAELALVGDAPPPAALTMVRKAGPLSSMTWAFNIVVPEPTTRDGWWLMRCASDHIRGGITAETRDIWSADGVRVAQGVQQLALFF